MQNLSVSDNLTSAERKEKAMDSCLRDKGIKKIAKELAIREIYEETQGQTLSDDETVLMIRVRVAQIFARLLTEKSKEMQSADWMLAE